MADEPTSAQDAPPKQRTAGAEPATSAPTYRPIVADTSHVTADSSEEEIARFVAAHGKDGRMIGMGVFGKRSEARFHAGPLPSPDTLRELAEIYPDAPKLIFEDFHAQSAHRREIEQAVITTKNTLALRGQTIGGILGGIGLVGSLVVAAMGQGWAGFGIAMGSLGSLVSIFMLGREEQKRERLDKEKLREQIRRGESIEKLEGTASSPSEKGNQSQSAAPPT